MRALLLQRTTRVPLPHTSSFLLPVTHALRWKSEQVPQRASQRPVLLAALASWKRVSEPLVTLIYLNDVLISFDAALRAVLQSSEVLKSYSLDTEPDDQQQWIVATPEARTEVAALYAQVRIDLPCVESADLQ